MTVSPSPRRRRRGRRGVLGWLLGAVVGAVLFGAGIAVGQALEDRPAAGQPVTSFATITPWTQTEGVATRTVTVTSP